MDVRARGDGAAGYILRLQTGDYAACYTKLPLR